MSKLIDELTAMGCEMKGTMSRFLDDEEFYEECFSESLRGKDFEELGKALEEGRVDDAFKAAHTLKGMISNMGLTSMMDVVVPIVEALRVGSMEGTREGYAKLMDERGKYLGLIDE